MKRDAQVARLSLKIHSAPGIDLQPFAACDQRAATRRRSDRGAAPPRQPVPSASSAAISRGVVLAEPGDPAPTGRRRGGRPARGLPRPRRVARRRDAIRELGAEPAPDHRTQGNRSHEEPQHPSEAVQNRDDVHDGQKKHDDRGAQSRRGQRAEVAAGRRSEPLAQPQTDGGQAEHKGDTDRGPQQERTDAGDQRAARVIAAAAR